MTKVLLSAKIRFAETIRLALRDLDGDELERAICDARLAYESALTVKVWRFK